MIRQQTIETPLIVRSLDGEIWASMWYLDQHADILRVSLKLRNTITKRWEVGIAHNYLAAELEHIVTFEDESVFQTADPAELTRYFKTIQLIYTE